MHFPLELVAVFGVHDTEVAVFRALKKIIEWIARKVYDLIAEKFKR
jgi:hypothetical protein